MADSWSHPRVGNVGLLGSLNLCLIIVSGVLANRVRYNMCFSSVLERRHLKSEIFDCKHIFPLSPTFLLHRRKTKAYLSMVRNSVNHCSRIRGDTFFKNSL